MPGLDSLYSIIVRLQNVGAAKAGFFTVRLSSVFLYDLWKMQNGKNELDRHSGLNFLSQNLGNHEGDLMDDWSAAYRTKITPVENGTRIDLELTLIFRSPPSLALFPWESIALCTIKVPRVVVDPAVKYTMDYTINSDKSKRKEGNITMSFVEEEQYSSGSKPQVFVPEREAYHRTLHDEP